MAGAVSIPGKVFVLGEYAVLADKPALVATLGRRFRMVFSGLLDPSESSEFEGELPSLELSPDCSVLSRFHPQSPAGRLLEWASSRGVPVLSELRFQFQDPHGGAGGFGASTAQFALLYSVLAERMDLPANALAARALYRDLMSTGNIGLLPSGADLVAQWSGGVVSFDPAAGTVRPSWGDRDWGDLLVFSAAAQVGRKVATHDHLRTLKDGELAGLADRLAEITRAASRETSGESLGDALDRYADELSEAGLEVEAARADRRALRARPGVLGVKGSGAMLADGVIVLMDSESGLHRASLIEAASARGLRLVANGLDREAGLKWES
jgi:mevalonate kinase